MNQIDFDGQQAGERILYTAVPYPVTKYLAIARLIFLAVFFFIVLWLIGTVVPTAAAALRLTGLVLALILLAGGFWWNSVVYAKSKTYITDRRIVRFDVVSPFFQTKRALFWNEALKAKAYAPNLLYRMLKVGTLEVEPATATPEQENIVVRDVYYFEDLGNYIDKILFTFKNKPAEVDQIRPFLPKPRGQRDG